MSEILKIALPNKGRLSQKIYDLLNSAGLNLEAKDERSLKINTKDNKFQLIFVRAADIPNFLDFSQYLTEETGFIINFQGWRVVFQSDSVVKEKIKPSWAQHFVPCTSWENMA